MQERSLEWYKKLFKQIMADNMEDYRNQYDIYQLLLNFKNDFDMQDPLIRDYAMKISKYAHGMADYMAGRTGSGKFNELYYDLLRIESPFLVDSFMRYIESNKPINKQFYTPRAHTLKKIIDAYQEVFDGKLDFLSVSQPKRTGKTSAGLRLALMMGGRNPDGSVFATGKGEGLVKSFYGGMLEVLDDPTSKYYDVFPEARLVRTKADEMTIDLKNKSRFSTFTCRPIDGSVVGNTEANVLLYIDDCVKNHEEARNRDRLEFLCEKITDDILGRRIEGTPIIIQGTKYSLYDPITFLQEKANELGWRWKEVAIPALDPITDESNFEIIKDGKRIFTTEYYRKEKKLVTDETWASEFQQEPYEAKGRMFPEKDLKTYFELPVDKDPDSILAVCDTAESGADSTAMPIAYIYGEDVFIEDVVFDNSSSDVTKPECAKKLVEHKVPTAVFESNNAGTYFARDVEEEVKKLGGKCSIRTKRTISNKLTRIEYASDNIKLHFYFKDKSTYEADSQYARFMKEVFKMTRSGKVSHDDAPDSLSLLENELRNILVASVKAVKNPLWR